MLCTAAKAFQVKIMTLLVPNLRAYVILTAFLNITGSSFLLWALKKTGQTSTISFHFIIMMSISDVIGSSSSAIILALITWKEYHMSCWMSSPMQFLVGTFNTFSFLMIVLIALDRYLHMRYLERYPSIFTKRWGHLLAIAAFFIGSIINGILLLPTSQSEMVIIEVIYVVSFCLFLFSIFILYRSAMRALRAKSSQLASSIITQTRTLSNTAKMVTICTTVLVMPLFTIQVVELADKYNKLMIPSLTYNIKWFAYITHTVNAFCSSVIFISQNRPIRTFIKRIGRCPHTRRSVVRPIDANMQNAKAVPRVLP